VKRHRLDPFSLIFGLTFMGMGAVLLDTDVDVADVAGAGWVPLPLVLLGLFLLAVGLERARSRPDRAPDRAPDPGPDQPGDAEA
jgi:hypothetical protein